MGQCTSSFPCEPPSTFVSVHAAQYDDLQDAAYPLNGKKMRTDVTLEQEYHIGPALGYGGFSSVRLATHRATRRKFACKIIPLPRPGHATNQYRCTRAAILREVDVLLELEHPCVVSLHEYYVQNGKLHLIMELLPGGELLEELEEQGAFSEPQARRIFRQLLLGVQYLHSLGIVHRDLKLENLLLKRRGDITSVKIADFGFARKHPKGDSFNDCLKTVCGTPEYMAPEIIRSSPKMRARLGGGKPSGSSASSSSDGAAAVGPAGLYGPAVDLWSCGVILYILLGGEPPFSSPSHPRLLHNIVAGRYNFGGHAWRHVSAEAKDLISRLLVVDPHRRLGVHAALVHPWMRRGSRGGSGACT